MEASNVDVRITRGDAGPECEFTDFEEFKDRASKLVWKGVSKGFEDFPIAKGGFNWQINRVFLTPENVCKTLTTPSGANESNHNELRNRYVEEELRPAEAERRGTLIRKLPIKTKCMPNYDWEGSPAYYEVDECEDVTDLIEGKRLPVAMFAVDWDARSVQGYAASDEAAGYARKLGDVPQTACGADGAATLLHSSYDVANTFDFEFIISAFEGRGFTAWENRVSCGEGDTRDTKFLMFNFGMQVYVPITVEEGGMEMDRTIIVNSSAATPSNWFLRTLQNWVEDKATRLWTGAMLASRVLYEAKANGWELTK